MSSPKTKLPLSPTEAQPASILIIDDDDLFRESLGSNLDEAGFSCRGFDNGLDALAYLNDETIPQLILLDWKMPEMSGIEVLRSLREREIEAPVIFLTVLGEQIYEEAALLGGAVDFVEKSRSFAILLRRINLILGGTKTPEAQAAEEVNEDLLRRGQLTVNLRAKRAFWNDELVDLTVAEFEVLSCLADRAGEDIGYRELYDQVRGEGFMAGEGEVGYRANVRALIKRIRKKFKNVDEEFDEIINYPGFGYRWNAESKHDHSSL